MNLIQILISILILVDVTVLIVNEHAVCKRHKDNKMANRRQRDTRLISWFLIIYLIIVLFIFNNL